MLEDRYGNALSTESAAARDAYVKGVDLFLAAGAGAEESFADALAADEEFALAQVGIARHRHTRGDRAGARQALACARTETNRLTSWERGHITTLSHVIEGESKAFPAARAHLAEHPRDAMVTDTCLGVFGLIGFSGMPGREAENLAFAETLAPHYGDDWWFLSQLSFAQMEAGQSRPAEANLRRAMSQHPRNAHAAHAQAHLYYETGQTDAGYAFLKQWRRNYSKDGLLHSHFAWHLALCALARRDTETLWQLIDADMDPNEAKGPALTVLADIASILCRMELAGLSVPHERWRGISDYALRQFPEPGLAFADLHAALAHAKAGNDEALSTIINDANGPAADLVSAASEGFWALAEHDWVSAVERLTTVLADDARLGGSRAQRDLLEYAMVRALLELEKGDEARRMLAMRRPHIAMANQVLGF
ncbi:MAG TPA: tetratricopeptide repeat protein [Alphaproteobacteria bacterium]|nr:tetratricopeptide repeat protein [Alphaproteobacteria bacterium]